jgi:glutathione S-transferase
MVRLIADDILTKEVLDWKGLHLFHFQGSSCSQKLRIFLSLKHVPWTSHHVDLFTNQNLTPYYLGINPRGLVPTLVHDGAVHIESNDIMTHLEECFPAPPLIPSDRARAEALLEYEDSIHRDLRIISFQFVFAPKEPPKSEHDLADYAANGSGTVGGKEDPNLGDEIEFWRSYAVDGLKNADLTAAALTFHRAFRVIDEALNSCSYIIGDSLSAVDIAWLIYAQRLHYAGYPLQLHSNLASWRLRLLEIPEIAAEVVLDPASEATIAVNRTRMAREGISLEDILIRALEGT